MLVTVAYTDGAKSMIGFVNYALRHAFPGKRFSFFKKPPRDRLRPSSVFCIWLGTQTLLCEHAYPHDKHGTM